MIHGNPYKNQLVSCLPLRMAETEPTTQVLVFKIKDLANKKSPA